MSTRYPERDGHTAAGARSITPAPRRLPRPSVAVHRHTCPNGVEVACWSQTLQSVGRVRDRYYVGPHLVARGVRNADTERDHHVAPDWTWWDRRNAEPIEPPAFAAAA